MQQVIARDEVVDGIFVDESTFPVVISPSRSASRAELNDWAKRRADWLRELVTRRGAVLIRGFDLTGADGFSELARSISPSLHAGYGDLEHEESGEAVYSSTVYPVEHPIRFHNESAQAPALPQYLFFYCLRPAIEGGATRLVDARRVLAELDPDLRARFEREPVTYFRNHSPHLDTSWQRVYGVDDPREAEQRCREEGVAFSWTGRDTLQTRVSVNAVRRHPRTDESVLIHQLFLFHPGCLDAGTRAGLEALYSTEEEYPRSVRWAGGAPISQQSIDEIDRLYEKHAVDHEWQPGDVVIIDNAIVAHGRTEFRGPRKILVAMSEMFEGQVERNGHSTRAGQSTGDPTAPIVARAHDPVPTVFRRLAREAPSSIAISREHASWSYADVLTQSLRTAALLQRSGVESGKTVAITGPRNFETIAAILGAWLNGQVVLLLDPALPQTRQELMLRAAVAEAVLYSGEKPAIATERPALSLDAVGLENVEGLRLPDLTQDASAYVIFTSGSTGVPKGVVGTHQGLAHFLEWQRTTFEVGRDDRIAQLTSFSFDVVLRDMFLSLTSGGTICLPPDDIDLADPWIWMRAERVTRLHAVPSLAALWLEQVTADGEACPTLRTAFFAGEPLTDVLVRRWRARVGSRQEVVNLYGPTETTLAKCWFRVPDLPHPGIQPIGRPLPGAQVLILDDEGRTCANGETGEIVIRTPYRTLGYLREDAALTSRFGRNPFSDDPHDIVYFTGDLGRHRADGQLDILGRKDRQIKVLGVRIEPHEIEAVLESHPNVRRAVVVKSQEDATGLTAYVVERVGETADRELSVFVGGRLPPTLVPRRFVHLDSLPLTPSGKVDRKSLPHPTKADVPTGPERRARTQCEQQLAVIWSDLLGVDHVELNDSFFALGGHSLLAMQLVARIREELRSPVQITHLFENPTLEGLALCVSELDAIRQPDKPNRISRTGPLPVSFAQERFWFLSQLNPDSGIYNIPGAVRISGTVDRSVVQSAVDALVARHAILRTSFHDDDGRPRQRITETARLPVGFLDVSEIPEVGRLAAVRDFAKDFLQQRFEPRSEPLARATLIREGRQDHLLVYVLDHTIGDGWSNVIFNREFQELYAAIAEGRPARLVDLSRDYVDFVEQERSELKHRREADLEFWATRLAGAPPVSSLPAERRGKSPMALESASCSRELSEALCDSVANACPQVEATLFMKLFAVFQVLLAREAGQRDLIVGTPIARRPSSDFDSVLGCFINTIALRTTLRRDDTYQSLLEQVRRNVLEAFAHPDAPIERVVEAVNPRRSRDFHPLFQVLFNYLTFDEPRSQSGDVRMVREWAVDPATKFDLTLYVRRHRSGAHLHLVYDAGLYEPSRMAALLADFEQLLVEFVEQPKRPLQISSQDLSPSPELSPGVDSPKAVNGEGVLSDGEGVLAGIWGQLLGVRNVSRGDSFIALGGHSLLATTMIARARESFDAPIPLRMAFDNPTLAELAAAIEGFRNAPPFVIPAAKSQALSSDQRRLLQIHQSGADAHFFNVPRGFRIRGPIDVDRLNRALTTVVQRHAVLRTLYASETDISVVQVESFPMKLVDLSGLASEDRPRAEISVLQEEARQQFRLASEVPLRATLIRSSEEDHVLVLTAHHIAVDCWSLGLPFQAITDPDDPWHVGLLLEELLSVYEAMKSGIDVPRRNRIEFSDYAAWQNREMAKGAYTHHAAFWKSHLSGAPLTIDLPTDFSRPSVQTLTGARRDFHVPASLEEQLARYTRTRQITAFAPLLAAFGGALSQWTGCRDVVVGTQVSNRNHPDTMSLIGPVGNTLAIRVHVDDRDKCESLIQKVGSSASECVRHQDYPFAELVRDVGGAPRDRTPVFQVRLVLQQAPEVAPCFNGLSVAPVKFDRGVSKYDLSIIVATQGRRLRGWCEYNTELFRAATIDNFASRYVNTLQAFLAAPKTCVRDVIRPQ